MKKPLMFMIAAFMFALCIMSFVELKYMVNIIVIFAILSLCSLCFIRNKMGICILSFFMMGLILFFLQANNYESFSKEYVDKVATYVGEVKKISKINDISSSIHLKVSTATNGVDRRKMHCSIHVIYTSDKPINCVVGDVISVNCKVNKFKPKRFFTELDSKSFNLGRKMYGQGYIDNLDCLKVIYSPKTMTYSKIVGHTYSYIENIIDENVSPGQSPVVKALILGDKAYLDEQDKYVIKISGLSHLIAISGMHLSIILMLLNMLILWIFSQRRLVNFFMIFLIIFYMSIVGNSISILRAGIMTIYSLVGFIIYRKSDVMMGLLFSAFAILLYSPRLITDVVFLLSFGATFGIIFYYPLYKEAFDFYNKILNSIMTSFFAFLGTILTILYFFYNFNTMSILSTVVALPIVTVILCLTIIMLILPFSAQVLGVLVDVLVDWFMYVCDFFATNNITYFEISQFKWYYVVIYVLGCYGVYLILTECIAIRKKYNDGLLNLR